MRAAASGPELSDQDAGFHERQVLMHCAMHTLNSLVGERWVTVSTLASIARELEVKHRTETSRPSLFNPFYHWAGPWVGNWDIMVIIEALKTRGMEVAHHLLFNPGRPEHLTTELHSVHGLLKEPTTVGMIVNERSQNWLMKLISGHHWYAVVPLRHALSGLPEDHAAQQVLRNPTGVVEPDITHQPVQWVNKDSKLPRPQFVGDLGTTGELLVFMERQVQERSAQVFVIRRTALPEHGPTHIHVQASPETTGTIGQATYFQAPIQQTPQMAEPTKDAASPTQYSNHSGSTDSPRTSLGERPFIAASVPSAHGVSGLGNTPR